MKLIPILNHMLLRESKRDELAIIAKYHIDDSTWKAIRAMDPSPTKKYTKYILLMIARGKFPEWYNELFDQQNYILNQKRLRQFFEMNAKKDFSSFKSWDEFKKFMEPYKDWVGKREMNLVKKDPNLAHVVFENDKCEVIRLKDVKAACAYGAGTYWCVSVKQPRVDFFKSYAQHSYLYEIISKTLKHSDDPVMFKLMLMVRKDSDGLAIVTADNREHSVTILPNEMVRIGSGPHTTKLSEYLKALSLPWNEIVTESVKNVDINSILIKNDGFTEINLESVNELNKYLKRNNSTLELLNVEDLRIHAYQLDQLNLTSLKGINTIYVAAGYKLILSGITNSALNEYIPKLKIERTSLEIHLQESVADFSFLGNITVSDAPLGTLILTSGRGGTTVIDKMPPPELIDKSKFINIKFSNVIIYNDIDLSKYENIIAKSQVNVSNDKSTLSINVTNSNPITFDMYKKYCTMESIIINPNTEDGVVNLDGAYSSTKLGGIQITKNLNTLGLRGFITDIAINSTSKKNIMKLSLVECESGLIRVYSSKEVTFRYCNKYSIDSDNHVEKVYVAGSTKTRLDNLDIVEYLSISGGSREIEFPKYVQACKIDSSDPIIFKKMDFEINKLTFSEYIYQEDVIKFISKLPIIPQEITPELDEATCEKIDELHEKLFGNKENKNKVKNIPNNEDVDDDPNHYDDNAPGHDYDMVDDVE